MRCCAVLCSVNLEALTKLSDFIIFNSFVFWPTPLGYTHHTFIIHRTVHPFIAQFKAIQQGRRIENHFYHSLLNYKSLCMATELSWMWYMIVPSVIILNSEIAAKMLRLEQSFGIMSYLGGQYFNCGCQRGHHVDKTDHFDPHPKYNAVIGLVAYNCIWAYFWSIKCQYII